MMLQGLSRERPRPPPAVLGGVRKVTHVQEKARREVGLSGCYLKNYLKPGLNRASRSLRQRGQHVYTCLYNNSKKREPQSNDKRQAV